MKFVVFAILVAFLIVAKGAAKDDDNSPATTVEAAGPGATIGKQLNEAEKVEKIGEDGCDPEGEYSTGCQIVKNEEAQEAKEMKAHPHHHHYLTNFHVAHRGDVDRIKKISGPMGRTIQESEEEDDNVAEQGKKSRGNNVPASPKNSIASPPPPEADKGTSDTALQSPNNSTESPINMRPTRKKNSNKTSRFKKINPSDLVKKSDVNKTKGTSTSTRSKSPAAPSKTPKTSTTKAPKQGLGIEKTKKTKAPKTRATEAPKIDLREVVDHEIFTYTEPSRLPEDADCSEITRDSHWEDQKPIRPCHYSTHYQPRQQYRDKWGDDKASVLNRASFEHLAKFNIRHDLDLQEAGEPCSVKLQSEFMHLGGEMGQPPIPIPLDVMSFNRVWYKRLCSFFSFLECIPANEVRQKVKPGAGSKKALAANEDLIYYHGSGHHRINTTEDRRKRTRKSSTQSRSRWGKTGSSLI